MAEPEPNGCRSVARLAAAFLLFSALALASGIALVSNRDCTGLCETAGLTLYGAGGPVSGLFASLAGGLVLAWPVDIIVWVVLAFGAARLALKRDLPITRVGRWVVAAALLWGALVSALIERA